MADPDQAPNALNMFQRSLQTQRESEEYIARMGGLPEITAAAEGILAVLAQTRQEIETATFASRFQDHPSATLHAQLVAGTTGFEFSTIQAIEREGEPGLKRAQLMGSFLRIQNDVMMAFHHLVELRADLVISQTEFDEAPIPTTPEV